MLHAAGTGCGDALLGTRGAPADPTAAAPHATSTAATTEAHHQHCHTDRGRARLREDARRGDHPRAGEGHSQLTGPRGHRCAPVCAAWIRSQHAGSGTIQRRPRARAWGVAASTTPAASLDHRPRQLPSPTRTRCVGNHPWSAGAAKRGRPGHVRRESSPICCHKPGRWLPTFHPCPSPRPSSRAGAAEAVAPEAGATARWRHAGWGELESATSPCPPCSPRPWRLRTQPRSWCGRWG